MISGYKLNEIKIEVTDICNLSCVHCSSNSSSRSRKSISIDKCLEIMHDASRLGATKVVFTGGEPLEWPHIDRAVSDAACLFDEVTIYSSGNHCSDISLCDLKHKGLTKVIYSLYSSFASEHDSITQIEGSFDLTLSSIKNSIECGLEVEMHFVAMRENYHRLGEICNFADRLGVRSISILRFVPQGRGANIEGELTKEQNAELRDMVLELRAMGKNVRTGSPLNVLKINDNPECPAGKSTLTVSPELNIFPCDAFKQINSSDIVGTNDYSNLGEHTLYECWSKSPYLDLVRHGSKLQLEDRCMTCSDFSKCNSGCLAQKYIHYGTIDGYPDPACLLIQDDGAK